MAAGTYDCLDSKHCHPCSRQSSRTARSFPAHRLCLAGPSCSSRCLGTGRIRAWGRKADLGNTGRSRWCTGRSKRRLACQHRRAHHSRLQCPLRSTRRWRFRSLPRWPIRCLTRWSPRWTCRLPPRWTCRLPPRCRIRSLLRCSSRLSTRCWRIRCSNRHRFLPRRSRRFVRRDSRSLRRNSQGTMATQPRAAKTISSKQVQFSSEFLPCQFSRCQRRTKRKRAKTNRHCAAIPKLGYGQGASAGNIVAEPCLIVRARMPRCDAMYAAITESRYHRPCTGTHALVPTLFPSLLSLQRVLRAGG
jgi:hypothetical protein